MNGFRELEESKGEVGEESSEGERVMCDWVKILIVDDNAFNSQVLSMMIQNFNNDVVKLHADIAFNGFEAIELVEEKLKKKWCKFYHIIFMDINMPEIDGFETTKRICKILGRVVEDIKIIALTANPWSELSDDLEDAGITHYIQKPIDRLNLETALQMFL